MPWVTQGDLSSQRAAATEAAGDAVEDFNKGAESFGRAKATWAIVSALLYVGDCVRYAADTREP